MATRSAQLCNVAVEDADEYHSVYVCPAGVTTIIKSVYINHPDAGGSNMAWAVGAGDSVSPITVNPTVPAYGSLEWEGWVVIEPGQYLATYSTSGFYTVVASGAELVGVA